MPSIFYTEPVPSNVAPKFLVSRPVGEELRMRFYDHIEVGRYHPGRTVLPGQLLIDDPTISRRHCFITQTAEGRCWIRDVSRNGTRLDGRRLVPNLEHEMHPGQALGLGEGYEFELEGADAVDAGVYDEATVGAPGTTVATILVGDIRDYTVLVRRASSEQLQHSVGRVFETLTHEVVALGGTVKEYQGDALFAFWEKADYPRQINAACGAALDLDRHVRRIATDRSVWNVDGFALEMDWALTTGIVLIDSFGGDRPTGLSMIGEPVVRAFRLEKFANEETGRILACEVTQTVASRWFRFRNLGKMQAKGFDTPDRVYALVEPLDDGPPEKAGLEYRF